MRKFIIILLMFISMPFFIIGFIFSFIKQGFCDGISAEISLEHKLLGEDKLK